MILTHIYSGKCFMWWQQPYKQWGRARLPPEQKQQVGRRCQTLPHPPIFTPSPAKFLPAGWEMSQAWVDSPERGQTWRDRGNRSWKEMFHNHPVLLFRQLCSFHFIAFLLARCCERHRLSPVTVQCHLHMHATRPHSSWKSSQFNCQLKRSQVGGLVNTFAGGFRLQIGIARLRTWYSRCS